MFSSFFRIKWSIEHQVLQSHIISDYEGGADGRGKKTGGVNLAPTLMGRIQNPKREMRGLGGAIVLPAER